MNDLEKASSKKKKNKISKLTNTLFRNALKSNLDMTSLADNKAGLLISINGFILTVGVTASSFAIQNKMMTYAFIAIIITSLGSIILAVLSVKPRSKKSLINKEYLKDYSSLLYYQDMADFNPIDYVDKMKKAVKSEKLSKKELTLHLHILAAGIKKKYFWLKQAYTFFSLGLISSALLIIYALIYVENTPFYNLSNGNVVYNKDNFFNIFEPSAATALPDGNILIAEDTGGTHSLKLVQVDTQGKLSELGDLYLPKDIKKIFKKGIEDIEGIASDHGRIYATTSHSLSKMGNIKESREVLMMFDYEDAAMTNFYAYKNLKEDLSKNLSEHFVSDLLFQNSVNIEGLAFDTKKKVLYLGLRAPLNNANAIIIGITNPEDIFLKQRKAKFTKPFFLNLEGQGIRDIAYDSDKNGFWIISGSSKDRTFTFNLWFLDATTMKVKKIRNHPDIGYAEGITVVHTNDETNALLIVKDDGKKPNKSADYLIIDRDSL